MDESSNTHGQAVSELALISTILENADKKAAIVADKANFPNPKLFISGRPDTCNTSARYALSDHSSTGRHRLRTCRARHDRSALQETPVNRADSRISRHRPARHQSYGPQLSRRASWLSSTSRTRVARGALTTLPARRCSLARR